ncbi:hypothetical protein [Dyella sp.]|jgi:hypothetical protein|uniref:hypothetical protein n=1 Tax=Dyella sp. TaxID=1869338 RepID=UPI002D76960B|nr:hypothetical protein [Dyella sp.]HET6431373.1 hypothetical protein [Dyella sp.]
MNRQQTLLVAALWATAILASAALHAPAFLSLILLPTLAAVSLQPARARACLTRSTTP